MTQSPDISSGPLAGVRVVDLTLALAGPLCTQRLGDMGAEVIKIEGPERPDFTRNAEMCGARLAGETTCYLSINRNKKSVALDLKSDAGRAALLELVKTADVVIQNMRPGVDKRLGVDYVTLSAIKPDLIHVSISGYGDEGPLVGWPGQDLLVQSFSGTTMNAGTKDDLPHPAPIYVVDVAASHNACEAVLAGLFQRGRTGRGVEAKVSLLKAVLEIQIQEVTTYMTTGRKGRRGAMPYASTWMEPPYGIYTTADGHLSIAQSDLDLIGDLLDEPRLVALKAERPDDEDIAAYDAWRDQIYPLVAAKLARMSTDDAFNLLSPAGVWCGPVLSYKELFSHPQGRGLLAEIDHPTAGRITTLAPAISFSSQTAGPLEPAPALGQHNALYIAHATSRREGAEA